VTDECSFDELLAEGMRVPVDGWDFSWFAGRASEERPSWGYARQIGMRMATATSALDVQTGGGEVLASIPRPPALLYATESWTPNAEIARAKLKPLGGIVIDVEDTDPLPFPDSSFDLVVSRHPTIVQYQEIARVLRPGGTYFAQQIGSGTNRELYEFLMGPQEPPGHSVGQVREGAGRAGLDLVDVREETLEVRFEDIAAVIVFLRKVIWTVPDFTLDRYRPRLQALHQDILQNGYFVSHSKRVLVEATKPSAR
jgi:SAM-dependent methyltransferase